MIIEESVAGESASNGDAAVAGEARTLKDSSEIACERGLGPTCLVLAWHVTCAGKELCCAWRSA